MIENKFERNVFMLKKRFIGAALTLCLILSSLFGSIGINAESVKKTINKMDSASAFTWINGDINVTTDYDTVIEGTSRLKLSMPAKDSWKGFTVLLPEEGMLDGADALYFYLKAPNTGAAENTNFQIFYEYSGVQITHNGDFTVYLQDLNGNTWNATTYWNGYGPNIPYGFEGFVKIPLTGQMKISYTDTDETEVYMSCVDKIGMYFSNFGGENGDLYLDALNCLVTDDGSPITIETPNSRTITVLNHIESANNIGWCDTDITMSQNVDYAVQGDYAMKFSMDEKQNWKGITVPLSSVGLIDGSDALYFYFKAPNTGSAENTWFQIFYQYDGVQITHNGDFNIYLQPKGTSEWETTTYWNGYGPNIPYGFEGFVKIPLTGSLAVNWSESGEENVHMESVHSLYIAFSNFGGENGDIYLDGFNAIADDDGLAVSGTELGDINWDGEINANDLAAFRRNLITNAAMRKGYADVNKSGKVDIADLIRLKKMIANPV